MAIAITLKQYLTDNHIKYDTLSHPYTLSSTKTAQASHIPGSRIAKAVLLKKEDDYLLAVLPASHHIRFDEIGPFSTRPSGWRRKKISRRCSPIANSARFLPSARPTDWTF